MFVNSARAESPRTRLSSPLACWTHRRAPDGEDCNERGHRRIVPSRSHDGDLTENAIAMGASNSASCRRPEDVGGVCLERCRAGTRGGGSSVMNMPTSTISAIQSALRKARLAGGP